MDVRFLRHGFAHFVAGLVLLAAADAASAQGTRTLFGSNPVGGSSTPGTSSRFGSGSQSTATPQRTGSTGATRPTAGRTGNGATMPGDVAAGFVPVGAEGMQAPTGFIGRSADEGPFVGRPGAQQNTGGRGNANRTRTTRSTRRSYNNSTASGQFGQNGLDPNLARGGTNRSERAGGQLRVVYRTAFSTDVARAPTSTQRISSSLTESPTFSSASGLSVEAEGNVVVLRGRVSSEYNRQLAERMALLRPGVSQVRNELVVSP